MKCFTSQIYLDSRHVSKLPVAFPPYSLYKVLWDLWLLLLLKLSTSRQSFQSRDRVPKYKAFFSKHQSNHAMELSSNEACYSE